MVKVEYPHLFDDDPAWHARADDLAARRIEFSDFLVNTLGVLDVGAKFAGRVTYHYACHLRMLGKRDEVGPASEHVRRGRTFVPLAAAGPMLRLRRLVLGALSGDFRRDGRATR